MIYVCLCMPAFLSDMMPSIPTHFIIAKSEASFVNTQVITDKIQEQIKMGRDSVGIRSQASAAAKAFNTALLNIKTNL